MTSRLGDTRTWVTAQVALDAQADVATFTPGRPVVLRRFGYIWNSGTTTAPETLDVDLDKRITIGSDTGRTTAIATIAGVANEAQGDGAFKKVGAAGGADVLIAADEEVVVQIANGATAGDGHVFIEYEELPFAGGTTYLGDLTDRDA